MQKIIKTAQEWAELLTSEQFHVTREKGTEPAFSGAYWDCHDPGVYHCVCCELAVFDARDKFDSGSGWPSYHRPIAADAVEESADPSHGMARVEIVCARCDAHLGHVFNDGPSETGLRYCINSLALELKDA